jgi:hypothetical protein
MELHFYVPMHLNYLYLFRDILWFIICDHDVATRYVLRVPEIESAWRRDFPHPSRLT